MFAAVLLQCHVYIILSNRLVRIVEQGPKATQWKHWDLNICLSHIAQQPNSLITELLPRLLNSIRHPVLLYCTELVATLVD